MNTIPIIMRKTTINRPTKNHKICPVVTVVVVVVTVDIMIYLLLSS
jgi:hypothetical protein